MLRKLRQEKGQGLVEYALILVLIAVVVLVVVNLLGNQVNLIFARITLALQEPGNFSGDPVTVTSVSANASGGCSFGTCSVTASASVSLSGASGSPRVCVQFNDSNGGGKLACGSPPSATFSGGGNSGTVTACVVAVEGHSLTGGPYCASASY